MESEQAFKKNTVKSPTNLQVAKFQRCECDLHVQSCSSHVYTVIHMHPQQLAVLLCTLLWSTVQSTIVQYLYFKTRTSGSKRESRVTQLHSHLPPPRLLQSVTFLAYSLNASPCVPASVLNYYTFQGSVLFK